MQQIAVKTASMISYLDDDTFVVLYLVLDLTTVLYASLIKSQDTIYLIIILIREIEFHCGVSE